MASGDWHEMELEGQPRFRGGNCTWPVLGGTTPIDHRRRPSSALSRRGAELRYLSPDRHREAGSSPKIVMSSGPLGLDRRRQRGRHPLRRDRQRPQADLGGAGSSVGGIRGSALRLVLQDPIDPSAPRQPWTPSNRTTDRIPHWHQSASYVKRRTSRHRGVRGPGSYSDPRPSASLPQTALNLGSCAPSPGHDSMP